jgi:DeoR/GlpR family transcriptional regulator of sugar metabolism
MRAMSKPEGSRLSKKRRQDRILAELRIAPTIRILDLVDELGVSYETIRRDLEEMSRNGLIDRTYGGAVARPFGCEPGWRERFDTMAQERERIAMLAARLIRKRAVIMIDAGSTVLYFARRLAAEAEDVAVITNCFAVAKALAGNPGITVLACPGRYDPHEGSVGGPDTIAFLGRFNADYCVISASGITAEGPNDAHSNSAAIKRAMLARCQHRILLTDHMKFDKPNLELVCPLSDINLVVADMTPPPPLKAALGRAGVELLF